MIVREVAAWIDAQKWLDTTAEAHRWGVVNEVVPAILPDAFGVQNGGH